MITDQVSASGVSVVVGEVVLGVDRVLVHPDYTHSGHWGDPIPTSPTSSTSLT